MDGMMGGCGLMCIGMWALIFIALVLLIVWLVGQIKK